MKADEIMQVLRLSAMSRVNHPDQQRFCDKLAEVFAGWVAPAAAPVSEHPPISDIAKEAAKRAPGRPKKAE